MKLDVRVQRLDVTAEAKTIVSGLLQLSQEQRMTLDQARTHCWLRSRPRVHSL